MLVYLSCLFTCQLRDLSQKFPRRTPPTDNCVFVLRTVKKILITAISENSSFLAKSLVSKIRMLQWMCGGHIWDDHIPRTKRVVQASKKIMKIELVHVMRRDEEHTLRKVLRMDLAEKRKRGRLKTRWKDACQRNIKSTGLRAGEEKDRATCRRKIISHTGDLK